MTPSRISERRRHSAWTGWRLTLIALGFLVFIAVVFVVYIRSADAGYRGEERAAVSRAKQEAGLTEVDAVSKHVWDDSVWVVEGKDASDTDWFVWLREDGAVKEKVADGYGEDGIRSRFNADHPGKKIARLLPGWFSGQPAWEIRYIDDPGTKRQAIVFYSFKNGSELRTYNLVS
ncbi:Uncharacterized protein YpmB [Cohnella sp. OV330]|uniref:cell wall elongation regulator TseB-like domain-containing protein n=1 Tax=Cohnella sp. OV330 TaxID=1855288 RepID=UPI0008EE7A88|nr:DUF5590 domain-containing protein [Cohnella sp. OV330]SFB17589.1 Uncharacterized protein YpmB [Cohnella sp. OV330]